MRADLAGQEPAARRASPRLSTSAAVYAFHILLMRPSSACPRRFVRSCGMPFDGGDRHGAVDRHLRGWSWRPARNSGDDPGLPLLTRAGVLVRAQVLRGRPRSSCACGVMAAASTLRPWRRGWASVSTWGRGCPPPVHRHPGRPLTQLVRALDPYRPDLILRLAESLHHIRARGSAWLAS